MDLFGSRKAWLAVCTLNRATPTTVSSETKCLKFEMVQRSKTHRAKAQNGVDVRVIFFNLFSEPHRLVIFLGVNVLGPAALEVVHTLAYILGSKCIDLKRKTGKVSILVGSNRITYMSSKNKNKNDVRELLPPPVLTSWCESSADTWIERLTGFLSM